MTKHAFDAVIFDLDGVITDTAATHSAAWKQMFDDFLRTHAEQSGTPFREFAHEQDYLPYVDGKPRYQGVASFLESRGIELPFGDPSEPPGQLTVCGLGNRKNELFNESIKAGKISTYQSTVDFMHSLQDEGIRIGVASSSRNAKTVLDAVGLLDLIETRVDGVVSAQLGLKGKPQADIFTAACDNLGVYYDRAVIVEDAISGVQAGQNGSFGLVIGVAREDNALELRLNGADLVVEDMKEIDIESIDDWLTKRLTGEQWSISYFDYHRGWERTRETLLSVGNGFFGTRGAHEETSAGAHNYPGTYIAGLYNRLESEVGGRIVSNEDFVNCPNWLPITFRIGDGAWFDPNEMEIRRINRRLDFRTGILKRSMVISDELGRETRLVSQRLASMDNPHLAALRYQIIPLNYDEKITVRSALDGDIENKGVARYADLSSKHVMPVKEEDKGNRSSLLVKTNQSNILIAEAARLLVSLNGTEVKPAFKVKREPGKVTTTFTVDAERGIALTVDKLVAIYASNQKQVEDPLDAAQQALSDQYSFGLIKRDSMAAWERIWEKIDIQVEGDRTAQKLLRLHLYHTMLTASPHNKDLDAGIPARGLSGESYRGHIFWDELYILPFLNLHFPETVRSALMYRYRRLGAAQKYAQDNGYEGAIFPWQSGSEGREETQTLHLNPLSGEWGPDHSTLQRHVSLAVIYNIWEYLWVSEDWEFLENYGAEVFLEVCRFWASKAVWNEKSEHYDISGVMGPDEFHEKYPGATEGGLRNNSYTNILVAWSLKRAFDLLEKISPDAKESLLEKLRLTDEELRRWQDISQKLAISLSEEGILEQFEGYFELKELDWENYQQKYDNIHRMDRILKAEGKSPDDYKVAKQADVLMAFYVLGEEEVRKVLKDLSYAPPEDLLRKNFYYYLQRTSHGSTLSRLVHACLALRIGDKQLSWQLYTEALKSDYIDIQGGTTSEGIHAGVMTGTVYFALRAFAGITFTKEKLHLKPSLPSMWREIKFQLNFKGASYHFLIKPDKIKVKISGKKKQSIFLGKKEILLKPEEWQEVEVF